MAKSPALYLVTHGSRNPAAAEFLRNLVSLVQAKSLSLVGGGLLEGADLSLADQLIDFAKTAQEYPKILILPIFLLAGVHVCQDLPEQVAIAQSNLGLELEIADYLGNYPQISPILQTQFRSDGTARILLSHGSRRSESLVEIEKLAQACQALTAFWAIAPSLETQVDSLINQGYAKITVLPYFLAAGGIMAAIKAQNLPIQLLDLPLTPEAIATLVIDYAKALVKCP